MTAPDHPHKLEQAQKLGQQVSSEIDRAYRRRSRRLVELSQNPEENHVEKLDEAWKIWADDWAENFCAKRVPVLAKKLAQIVADPVERKPIVASWKIYAREQFAKLQKEAEGTLAHIAVASIARPAVDKWTRLPENKVHKDDYMAAMAVEICKAIRNFDPPTSHQGRQFFNYIKSYMKRIPREANKTEYPMLKENVFSSRQKIMQAQEALYAEGHSRPSVADIANKANVSQKIVTSFITAPRVISADKEYDGFSISNLLTDTGITAQDALERRLLFRAVDDLINTPLLFANPENDPGGRQAVEILTRSYGIGREGQTKAEIAKALGISKTTIAKKEKAARKVLAERLSHLFFD